MIGARIGPRIGARIGARIGLVSPDASAGLVGVAQDATSLKYRPANLAQWTTTKNAAGAPGTPSFLWNCQEAAGNLADSIGACTLTAANAPLYQQAVAGWASKAVGWTHDLGQKFTNTVSPPDGSTTSQAMLCYQYVTALSASTALIASMTTFAVSAAVDTSGKPNGLDNGVGVGTETITDGVVRPFLLVYNRAATTCFLYTGVDKIDCTYTSSAGVNAALGAFVLNTPSGGCTYAAMFTGAAAEMTAAQAKSLLQTLGWSVSWT